MKNRTLGSARPHVGVAGVIVLSTLMLWPGGAARASGVVEVVDAVGDATPVPAQCDLVVLPPDACGTARPGNHDGVDIVEGNLTNGGSGSDLVMVARLADLDAEASYAMAAGSNGVSLHVSWDPADGVGGRLWIYGPDGTGTTEVPMALDFTADTVTWTVGLSDLNAALGAACSSCSAFAVGTLVDWASVSAWYQHIPVTDGASAETAYAIGDA